MRDKERARSLPRPPAQARVDFIGRVTSADDAVSPLSGVSAAIVEIVGFETHIQFGPHWLGSRRYGDRLEVVDAAGTRLGIRMTAAVRVSPTSLFPTPLPNDLSDLPPELAQMLPHNNPLRHFHLHETVLRFGDRVRVVGTIGPASEAPSSRAGPYRSSAGPELVALPDEEPFILFELPSEGD